VGTFHIVHFIPSAVDPAGECEYSNLLYACATCNEAKKAILGLPDPCRVSFRECLQVRPDGRVEALNSHGRKLEQVLLLNSDSNVRHRSRWMRNLEALKVKDPSLYQEYMGFPDDLPDLRLKLVPHNTRPEGAANCYFALRERGELPLIY
jgi:hypothetical protein